MTDIEKTQAAMCRELARNIRQMADTPRLKGRRDEMLKQADEWDRLALLAEQDHDPSEK